MVTDTEQLPDVYEENGTYYFRASAIGSCARALVLQLQGIEPTEKPEWLLEKFEQGKAGETRVLILMRRAGWKIGARQKKITVPIGKEIVITGHIDGMGHMISDTTNELLEIKCVGDSMFKNLQHAWRTSIEKKNLMYFYENYPVYGAQLAAYHHALQTIRKEPIGAYYVLGLKDDDGKVIDFKTLYFPADLNWEKVFEKVREHAIYIVSTIKSGEELPECNYDMFPCSYFDYHDKEELIVHDDKYLGMLAAKYNNAAKAEKEAKENKEQTKKLLEGFWKEHEPGDKVEAKWKDKDGEELRFAIAYASGSRSYLDEDAMRKDKIDLGKYRKENKYRYFRVSVKE